MGAFVFGPLWLAWHRAFLAAFIAAAADVIVAAATEGALRGVLLAGIALLLGLLGSDCRRSALTRAGFALSAIVAAPTLAAALIRLLEQKPELRASLQ